MDRFTTLTSRPTIAVDLDDTVVNAVNFHVYVGKDPDREDFDRYNIEVTKALPNYGILEMIQKLRSMGYAVIAITARNDRYDGPTRYWTDKHRLLLDAIYYRPYWDERPDWQVKSDILDSLELPGSPYQVLHMVEDNPSCVQMLRRRGLSVTDVGRATDRQARPGSPLTLPLWLPLRAPVHSPSGMFLPTVAPATTRGKDKRR